MSVTTSGTIDLTHEPAAPEAPAVARTDAAPSLVPVAFAVGWQMAELYHSREIPAGRDAAAALPDGLPGVGELDPLHRIQLRVEEVRAGLHTLFAGVAAPDTGALQSLLDAPARAPGDVRRAILDLHQHALCSLYALDFRLGKAYGLGRALAETALVPRGNDRATYVRYFDSHRMATLHGWLADLKTSLPDYAAEATRGSLTAWEEWVARPTTHTWSAELGLRATGRTVDWDADAECIERALRRQGKVWRSVLSGEKKACDLLVAGDYVGAAVRLVHQLRSLTGQFVKRSRTVVSVAMLVAVVVAGAITAIALTFGSAAGITTAIISAVGGLGVTWKSVSATLGKAIARAEQPVWETELNVAVAAAATRLPLERASEDAVRYVRWTHRGRRGRG